MQHKLTSWLVRFSLALVPVAIAGCAADGNDGAAPTPGDAAVEKSYDQLEPRIPREDLIVSSSHVSPDGSTHVRFHQLFQGVPVFEGEVITHVDKNGKVTETNALRSIKNLNVTPNISKDEAVAFARDAGPADGSVQILDAKLMVLPNGDHDQRDRLTWYVRLLSEGGADGAAQWDTFVDAHNGKLALVFDTLHTTEPNAHGKTQWNGSVDLWSTLTGTTYSLIDAERNTRTCDFNNKTSGTCVTVTSTTTEGDPAFGVFGDGSITNRSTAAADVHYGLQQTLGYYKTVLGRNGIEGAADGATTLPVLSRVHYGSNYENAFWTTSCGVTGLVGCMTYGDGGSTLNALTTLDITGHEVSHGMMSREANLTYRGESGGLNESNSDIFGTLVEFYANNSADVPDWLIGERVFKGTRVALRYMNKPSLDGKSPNCWSSTLKRLDVHYSSGPNNHMFYLLAQEPGVQDPPVVSACNGKTVPGIGRDKAAKIWYRAVRDFMTSSTTYAGARVAVINAVTALVAEDGVTFQPSDIDAVKAAYAAINVN